MRPNGVTATPASKHQQCVSRVQVQVSPTSSPASQPSFVRAFWYARHNNVKGNVSHTTNGLPLPKQTCRCGGRGDVGTGDGLNIRRNRSHPPPRFVYNDSGLTTVIQHNQHHDFDFDHHDHEGMPEYILVDGDLIAVPL
jgi:hypothetical protein